MASEEGQVINCDTEMASGEGRVINCDTEMASVLDRVINCDTVDLWNELLQKGIESKKMLVVHFTTGRWGTRIQVGSLLDPLVKRIPGNIYVKIIVDKLKSVAEEFGVEATPTFVFIKEGKMVDRVVSGCPFKVTPVVGRHSLPFKVGPYEFNFSPRYKVTAPATITAPATATITAPAPATITPTP